MTADRFGIVGKVVARTYQVEEVVAEGGFGVVYRAYHKGFRAKVALKCLKIPAELTEEQRQKFLEQFRSEAEVLFRLSGQIPNIVRPLHVDAFHTKDGLLVPFMAQEWLEGRTLDAIILRRAEKGRPPLSLRKLVRLLTPVARALEHAHHLQGDDGTLSVVHRDMKPENLFIARVGDEDVAKVLDFGISKVKSAASQLAGKQSHTASAFVSFSPAYGAPEQWAPRRFGGTGRWTDVWGLALTVVEAAKGDEVVSGDHAEMMGTIIDPARRPTPRSEGLDVSDEVEGVFLKALAVDPRHRYQTVGQFWDELSVATGMQREVGTIAFQQGDDSQKRRGRSTDGFDSVIPAGGTEPRTPQIPHAPAAPSAGSGGGVAPGAPQPSGGLVEGFDSGRYGIAGQGSVPARPAPLGSSSSLELARVSRPPRAMSPSRPVVVTGTGAGHRKSLVKALRPALALVALSVAFTALDRAFALKHGHPLSIASVKASWLAAGLMVMALVAGIKAIRQNLD